MKNITTNGWLELHQNQKKIMLSILELFIGARVNLYTMRKQCVNMRNLRERVTMLSFFFRAFVEREKREKRERENKLNLQLYFFH